MPSEQLRLMIEAFVTSNIDSDSNPFTVHVFRPEGYDYGLWRVTVTLKNPNDAIWLGAAIPFMLPELPMRLVESDPEYRAVIVPSVERGPVIGGRFDNGIWRGHIRTNGCDEAMNPTDIGKVKDAIGTIIDSMLQKFHGYPSFVAQQKKRVEQYKKAEVIAGWIKSGTIWTKNPETSRGGRPTPGIHGRNVVVAFCDSMHNDNNLYVISRYVSRRPGNVTDDYHLYVTEFEDWVTYMVPVDQG